MGYSCAQKLIRSHCAPATDFRPGGEIPLRIDQTLTQDATGTMAFLEFEAMGVPGVRTELSVSYIDHNTLQTGFENADDHAFLASAAAKYGVRLSRAGNGICHFVHLERFAVPGRTLLGSDSHTPTCGGLGMLAIGAGGLDVAMAMGGYPFVVRMPRIVRVLLTGSLPPWCSAKDIVLELLHRLSTSGGVGKIFEYAGPGIATLSVYERGTITNMGAELGATSSVFPSDERTREFLKIHDRERDYAPLEADPDATYDDTVELDLSKLEPLVALPHSPDAVVPVREVAGTPLDQVFIGSCTNGSYLDMARVAAILRGKVVPPNISLCIAPGSRSTVVQLSRGGELADLAESGARILESACGPCVGIGQAPRSGGASLRTSNRNFEGRTGTKDARVYLASAETAAASALRGCIVDPRTLGEFPSLTWPESLPSDDRMIVMPPEDGSRVDIVRGPNIAPLPVFPPLWDDLDAEILLVLGDDVTTDHIMPAGAKILPLRSNIPEISKHCFELVDPTFPARARESGAGAIVAGDNYGQGSSREHAALAPRYLGVRAVVAKSFARIHRQNLVNFGILPLQFDDPAAYALFPPGKGGRIRLRGMRRALELGRFEAESDAGTVRLVCPLSERERGILLAGGLLNLAAKR